MQTEMDNSNWPVIVLRGKNQLIPVKAQKVLLRRSVIRYQDQREHQRKEDGMEKQFIEVFSPFTHLEKIGDVHTGPWQSAKYEK